jgi:hypothetical protein
MSTGLRRSVAGVLTLIALFLMFALLWAMFSTPFASTLPGMTGHVELDDGNVATWTITHAETIRAGTLVIYRYKLQSDNEIVQQGGGQDHLPKGVRTTEGVEEWLNDVVRDDASRGEPQEVEFEG